MGNVLFYSPFILKPWFRISATFQPLYAVSRILQNVCHPQFHCPNIPGSTQKYFFKQRVRIQPAAFSLEALEMTISGLIQPTLFFLKKLRLH